MPPFLMLGKEAISWQDKLVEIAYLNENIAGTAMASSYGGQATPSGNFLPDVMTLGGDGDAGDLVKFGKMGKMVCDSLEISIWNGDTLW